MMDKQFQIANFSHEPEALEAIRRLENQLTEMNGEDVALVAYAAQNKNDEES